MGDRALNGLCQRCCCIRLQIHQCMIELHWAQTTAVRKERSRFEMESGCEVPLGQPMDSRVHSQEARACLISAQLDSYVTRKLARPLHCAKHVKCNEGGGSL